MNRPPNSKSNLERAITAKVCDFQSAADARLGDGFTWFSIWF